MSFVPPIHYTLPQGWGNFEDTRGNFLLIPPGGSLAGVNPGTSDFIGVYSGIAAEGNGCTPPEQALGVGTTPATIAGYWTRLKTITATKPRPVTVGGLRGLVLDMVPNSAVAKAPCTDPTSSYGAQPLIIGVGPAGLDHGMIKRLHLRVFLLALDGGTSTLAIEVDDLHAGTKLAGYSKVVEALKFENDQS